MGEDSINRALKWMIKHHGYPNKPAISLDLIAALKAQSATADHAFIDEWFKDIILYNLAVISSHSKQLTDGRYQVTIELKAQRYQVTGVGEETETAINHSFDVGIYSGNYRLASAHSDEPDAKNKLLHLQAHHFTENRKTIVIIVDKKPTEIVIDPYIKVIDKQRENNISRPTSD